MKRTWTIIGVRDVRGSFKWYRSLFGQPETPPSHDHFGQILDTDGTVVLCLHRWGAHEHPSLMSPDEAPPGNGLLLFFRVDDFDIALKRARALVFRLEEEPHVNPNTQTREFSLRIRTDTTSQLVRSLRLSPRQNGLRKAGEQPQSVAWPTRSWTSSLGCESPRMPAMATTHLCRKGRLRMLMVLVCNPRPTGLRLPGTCAPAPAPRFAGCAPDRAAPIRAASATG